MRDKLLAKNDTNMKDPYELVDTYRNSTATICYSLILQTNSICYLVMHF